MEQQPEEGNYIQGAALGQTRKCPAAICAFLQNFVISQFFFFFFKVCCEGEI